MIRSHPILVSIAGVAIIFIAILIKAPDVKPPDPNIGSEQLASNSLSFPERSVDELDLDVQKIRQEIIDGYKIDNNGDLLLYRTTAYEINYLRTFGFFFVTIQGGSPPDIKKQAEQWFRDWGLKQGDLCDLPVRFILQTTELRSLYSSFSSLPSGCSTPNTETPSPL